MLQKSKIRKDLLCSLMNRKCEVSVEPPMISHIHAEVILSVAVNQEQL